MTISFIIPVYNRAAVVGRCLDSILANDHDLIKEIVVVDDGSTDDSIPVVQHYVDQYPGLIHLVKLETNSGVSAARNKGLEHVTGDYVWFVDSDDFVARDALDYLSKVFAKFTFDIYRFSWLEIDSQAVPPQYEINDTRNVNFGEHILFKTSQDHRWRELFAKSLLCNAIYRREIAQAVLFQPYPNGEDRLYATECLLHSDIVVFNPSACLYGYVRGQPSATSNATQRMLFSYIDVTLALIQAYEQSGLSEQQKQWLYEAESSNFFPRILAHFALSEMDSEAWGKWRIAYRTIFVENPRRASWKRFLSGVAHATGSRWVLVSNYLIGGKFLGLRRKLVSLFQSKGAADNGSK